MDEKRTSKTPDRHELFFLKCWVFQLLWMNPGKNTMVMFNRLGTWIIFIILLCITPGILEWWLKMQR